MSLYETKRELFIGANQTISKTPCATIGKHYGTQNDGIGTLSGYFPSGVTHLSHLQNSTEPQF